MCIARWISIACLLTSAPQLQSASVAIDSFCSTDQLNGSTTTDSFSVRTNAPTMGGCSIGTLVFPLTEPFSEAFGAVDFGTSSGESAAQAYISGYVIHRAYQSIDAPYYLDSATSVSLTLDLIASSPGPPRPGQILLTTTYLIAPDQGGGGSYLECEIEGLSAPFGFCPLGEGMGSPEGITGLFPFPLGTPFNIHIGAFGIGTGDTMTSPSDGSAGFNLSIQLLELDGTPVDVRLLPVPEPSTLLLVASVLPILALRRLRRL